jgi:cytochrome P450
MCDREMLSNELPDIYKNERVTKPKAYMALGPGLTGFTVFTATYRQLHRKRRQLIGQVLTDRLMRTFEPIMVEQIDLYLLRLLSASRTSKPVEMTKYSRQLGFNIAGILGFGYDLGLQTEETNQFMLTMLDAGTLWSSVFLQYPGARRFRLALVSVKAFRTLRGAYLGIIEKMISLRTGMPKDAKHDLYSFVADSLNDQSDSGIRDSELWGEANLFLTAGKSTPRGLNHVPPVGRMLTISAQLATRQRLRYAPPSST